MKKVNILIRVPFDMNEALLDLVARKRKSGVKTSKEEIILSILTEKIGEQKND